MQCEHEDMNSNSNTYVQSQVWLCEPTTPAVGTQRQVVPKSLLTISLARMVSFWFNERPCLTRIRCRVIEEAIWHLSLAPKATCPDVGTTPSTHKPNQQLCRTTKVTLSWLHGYTRSGSISLSLSPYNLVLKLEKQTFPYLAVSSRFVETTPQATWLS